MAKSDEEFIEERRRGFVTGLAVSELMLLILFALLLFLVEGEKTNEVNREVIDNFGGDEVAENMAEAISNSPEIQRVLQENPEVIDLWITLTTSGALDDVQDNREIVDRLVEEVSEMESENQALEDLIAEQNEISANLNERLTAANIALMDGVRKGGTTLCTYASPNIENPRPRSLPLGVVFLQNEGVTLLLSGYDEESLIDAYGESIDPVQAIDIVNSWGIDREITFEEFRSLNSVLATLGDEYATETRQNCRYYFDYYFEDISADNLDLWNRLNYSGVKISSERFHEIQQSRTYQ